SWASPSPSCCTSCSCADRRRARAWPPPPPETMAYKLVLRWADRREERPLAGTKLRLGRDASDDLVIASPDRSVSRFHARLDFDGRAWTIVDTKSTNGVRVNGAVIERDRPHALADGDRLLLGNVEGELVREEGAVVLT